SFLSVTRAADLAHVGILVGQPLAALTHPTDASRRDADHQRIGRHIFGDDAPRANEGVFIECDAANYGRISSDRRSPADQRALVFFLARYVSARIDDVGEDHRGAAKNIVFQLDALVHRHVVLNLDVVADADAV